MKEHLALLERNYPGQSVLTPAQVAKVLASATRTIYNQVSSNTFPIRPIYKGNKWVCSIIDVARYLVTGVPQLQLAVDKPKRGRKPSPRQVLKFKFTWGEEDDIESSNLPLKPSSRQIIKYQAFWQDVIEKMGQLEQKVTVLRETPPREIR